MQRISRSSRFASVYTEKSSDPTLTPHPKAERGVVPAVTDRGQLIVVAVTIAIMTLGLGIALAGLAPLALWAKLATALGLVGLRWRLVRARGHAAAGPARERGLPDATLASHKDGRSDLAAVQVQTGVHDLRVLALRRGGHES